MFTRSAARGGRSGGREPPAIGDGEAEDDGEGDGNRFDMVTMQEGVQLLVYVRSCLYVCTRMYVTVSMAGLMATEHGVRGYQSIGEEQVWTSRRGLTVKDNCPKE